MGERRSADPLLSLPGAVPAEPPDPFGPENWQRVFEIQREGRLTGRQKAQRHLDQLQAEREAAETAAAEAAAAKQRAASPAPAPVSASVPSFDFEAEARDRHKSLDALLDEIAAEDAEGVA